MNNGFMLFRGLLKRYPIRLLITALCAFYCFISYFGLFTARTTLIKAEEDFLSQCGKVDILLSCEPMTPSELKKILAEINGVESFSTAYQMDYIGDGADKVARTFRLLGFEGDSLLNPILEGEPDSGDSFYVSYGYLSDFGKEHLTNITLENGRKLQLQGVCYLPIFTSVYIDQFTVSTNGDIVDAFTDIDTIWQMSGQQQVNLAFINIDPAAKIDTVIGQIRENKALSTEYVIPFSENPALTATNEILSLADRICNLFPFILFGTGLIIICIFLSGMASRAKQTVAILLSDGESLSGIFLSFFLSAFVMILLGMVSSLPVAMLLAKGIVKITSANMGIPCAELEYSFGLVIGGMGLSIGVSLIAGAICVATVRGGSIISLKRRSKKKKISAFSDIFVFGICSAIAFVLILTTYMYRDSVSAIREELFFDRYNFDAEIIYSDFVPLTRLDEIEEYGNVQAEPILLGSAEFSFGENGCQVSGVSLLERETMLRFRDMDGNQTYPVQNQIVLAEPTARKLGISPGDVLQTEINYGNHKIEIMCLVSGISEQYSAFTQIISIDTVTEYLDSSGVMNGALVKLNNACQEEIMDFLSYAKKLDDVYAVQLRSGAITRFDNRFEGVRKLVGLIILVGVMLGFFIFILMGYSIWRKNLRKNSILLMLGKSPLGIAVADLAKGLIGALFGFLLGIPLSIFVEKKIIAFLSTEDTLYPFIMRQEVLFGGIGLVCLYAVITIIGYTLATKYKAKDIL